MTKMEAAPGPVDDITAKEVEVFQELTTHSGAEVSQGHLAAPLGYWWAPREVLVDGQVQIEWYAEKVYEPQPDGLEEESAEEKLRKSFGME